MHRQTDLVVRKRVNAYNILFSAASSTRLEYTFSPDEPQGHPVTLQGGGETYVRLPEGHLRPYFILRKENTSPIVAADVAVEIESVENLRDLGGYLTTEGRVVRWGRFFRSGAISGLSDREKQILKGLNLRYVLDYRSLWEAQQTPDELDGDTEYFEAPAIGPGNPKIRSLAEMDMLKELRDDPSPARMEEVFKGFLMLYEELPFDNPAYRSMLGTLDHLQSGAMLQHCSAGKDRTGVGCAILLLALGVDEGTVMEDYLLSSIFRERHNQAFLAKIRQMMGEDLAMLEVLRRMMDVTPDLLQRSFDAIKARYGTYERYFQEEYGVDAFHLANWRSLHTLPLGNQRAEG